MNRPFPEQGIAPASATLVYAVNTLHAARDLGFTLREVGRALRPGGVLVASECMRTPVPVYADSRRGRVRVPRDVGERLGDHVVRGGLDVRREAFLRRLHLHRQRRARGERLDRRPQPSIRQDGRMDAAGELAELRQRLGELGLRAREKLESRIRIARHENLLRILHAARRALEGFGGGMQVTGTVIDDGDAHRDPPGSGNNPMMPPDGSGGGFENGWPGALRVGGGPPRSTAH